LWISEVGFRFDRPPTNRCGCYTEVYRTTVKDREPDGSHVHGYLFFTFNMSSFISVHKVHSSLL